MLATAAVLSLSCVTNCQRGTAAHDHTSLIQTRAPKVVTLGNSGPGPIRYSTDTYGNST